MSISVVRFPSPSSSYRIVISKRNNYGNHRDFDGHQSRYGEKNFSLETFSPVNKSVRSKVTSIYKEHPSVASMKLDQVNSWRKEQQIHIIGNNGPNPILDFAQAPFNERVVKNLIENYQTPTSIQSQSWPIALSGKDMVGCAKTGSGKTLAYILPAFEHIIHQQQNSSSPTVLVLAPTRELVQQIQAEADKYCHPYRVMTASLFGGTGNRTYQYRQMMQRPQLVVANPGRLLDFINNAVISLNNVSYLVLDEADRMLDMGFEPQIRNIVNRMGERQTLMFSATWPKEIQNLVKDYLVNPIRVNIGSLELSANEDITQDFIFCESSERPELLINLLKKNPPRKTLIFVATKLGADILAKHFVEAGIHQTLPFATLHGDKIQSHRNNIIEDFRSDKLLLVIATDVASRGLDVKDIDLVINYDMTGTIESYIHRIGRTGRAGKKGQSLTFFTPDNYSLTNQLREILIKAGQAVPPQLNPQQTMAPLNSNSRSSRGFMPNKNNLYGDNYYRSSQPPPSSSPFNFVPPVKDIPEAFLKAKKSLENKKYPN